MSGYADGEKAIRALVQSTAGFSAATVTRGDWKVLNSGKAATYAILLTRPNGERVFDTPRSVLEPYTTVIQVWQRYKNDGSTYEDLAAAVSALLAKLDAYPHLGDTTGYIEEATSTLDGGVQEMWRKSGGPGWLSQNIAVNWTGRQTITFLD